MRTAFFTVLLCMGAPTTLFAATITVAQDGSGMVNSVQIAIASAVNGDEIVILDSAIYDEDVVAGAGAGFAAQFTLRAAEGQTPTIRAVNTASRLEALGVPGPDLVGALFSGCMGATIEGITFVNTTTELSAADTSCALGVMDCTDITIRNCTIVGAGGQGTAYAGNNVGTIVAGITFAPTGIVYEDRIIEDCQYGIAFSLFVPGVPVDPSVTVRGCIIRNCNENGIEIHTAASPEPRPCPGLGVTGMTLRSPPRKEN